MSNLTVASKLSAGRKALAALAIAAVVGVALSPAAASAKGWGHHHGGYGAAAFAGGLIVGAIVADAAADYDAPACWTEKRVRYGAYGERYVTRVRVCD